MQTQLALASSFPREECDKKLLTIPYSWETQGSSQWKLFAEPTIPACSWPFYFSAHRVYKERNKLANFLATWLLLTSTDKENSTLTTATTETPERVQLQPSRASRHGRTQVAPNSPGPYRDTRSRRAPAVGRRGTQEGISRGRAAPHSPSAPRTAAQPGRAASGSTVSLKRHPPRLAAGAPPPRGLLENGSPTSPPRAAIGWLPRRSGPLERRCPRFSLRPISDSFTGGNGPFQWNL